MHDRSIVTSPDGAFSAGQLICASNSYKFYVPSRPSRDETYDFPPLERNLAQELFTIGYYDGAIEGLVPAEGRRDETDVFVLSMSFFQERARPTHLGSGGFGIATQHSDGRWVNAVDPNFGGTKRFVAGPWRDGYELGTYGVDPSTMTAWAVLNHDGEFVVARDIEEVPGLRD
jgi:hypothetical protein